jgi:hypothetical protein
MPWLWSSSRLPVSVSDAATVAQEQRLAQLDLQRAHLAAQSRLRHAQHECCLAEAAVFGHVDEGFELVQIHWPIFA